MASQFDWKTINRLNKLFPESTISKSDLPTFGAGSDIFYNGVRRVGYKYKYKGAIQDLGSYTNSLLKEILDLPKAEGQEALRGFMGTFREQHVLKMPVGFMQGIADEMAVSEAVRDIDAEQAFSKLPRSEQFNFKKNWIVENAAQGHGWSGSGESIGDFFFSDKSTMPLGFGKGTQEEVRKYLTLYNAMDLGEFGTSPTTLTNLAIENAHRHASSIAFNSKNTAIDQVAEQTMSRYLIKDVQFIADDPNLIGNPIFFKHGSFSGEKYYTPKELTFSPLSLQSHLGKESAMLPGIMSKIHAGKGTFTAQEMTAIRSASLLDNNAEFTALLEQGNSPTEALEAINRSPEMHSKINSVAFEDGKVRLQYGQEQRIGPGTKFSTAEQKALGGFLPKKVWEGRGYNQAADAVIAPISGAESQRQLLPFWNAIDIWATKRGDVTTKLRNAHSLVEIINQHADIQAATSGIKYAQLNEQAIRINVANEFKLTPKFIEDAARILNPQERNELLRSARPVLPQYISVLNQSDFSTHGKIEKAGIQDVVGLMNRDMPLSSRAVMSDIGARPLAKEYQQFFGDVLGKNEFGGIPLPPEEFERLARQQISYANGEIVGGEGSKLFDPNLSAIEKSQRYSLDLGRDYSAKVGKTNTVTLNKVPVLSMNARQMTAMPGSGTVWAGDVNKPLIDLVKARQYGTPDQIQATLQNYLDATANLSGKGRSIVEEGLKTRLQGTRGTGNFLSSEQVNLITQQFTEGSGNQRGIVALTLEQAKHIFGDMTTDEFRSKVKTGLYGTLQRYPSLTGYAPFRVGMLTKKVMKAGPSYGKKGIMGTADIGSAIEEDLDADMVTALNLENLQQGLMSEAENVHNKFSAPGGLYEVAQAKAETKAMPETRLGESAWQRAKRLSMTEEPTTTEVGMALLQKAEGTGKFNVASLRVLEGAQQLGYQNAADLHTYVAKLSQKGYNAKLRGMSKDVLEANISDIFWGSTTKAERAMQLGPLLEGIVPEGQDTTKIAHQIIEAHRIGSKGGVISDLLSLNRPQSFENIGVALNSALERAERSPIGSDIAKSGMVHAIDMLGAQNASLAQDGMKGIEKSAKERLGSFSRYIKESTGDFVAGLRQGKGWTSVAIGAAVLAGVGLGMRKPGTMIVQGENAENHQSPPAEAPMITPRKESKLRLMTENQYDVRVKIREARRQHSSKFVDFVNAISHKYDSQTNAQVNIRDDSSEQDYQKIFADQYRRSMRQG
jgi:hypothetical protein